MTKPSRKPGHIRPEMTPQQRLRYRFMHDQMMQFEWDLRHAIWDGRIVPSEWHRLLQQEPVRDKTRVTLRLDSDLVKFFKAYGPGWQTILNRAVRVFVKARLAGVVEGPESAGMLLEGLSERPGIGSFENFLAGEDTVNDSPDGKATDGG